MSTAVTDADVRALREALIRDKRLRDKLFIPWDKSAQPFQKQKDFLSDPHLTKLARCGNRAAKTFTTMRDLAWKVMRKHWYLDRWNCASNEDYMDDGGKIFWVVAPTFDFLKEVCWEQYLKRFIPEWYYVDDDFVSGVVTRKEKGVEIIDSVKFRNGDTIIFKTYSQNLLSKMGKAVDGVYIDEMPPHLNILVELVTRTLDNDGFFILGFTPVVINEEIKDYVDNHKRMHVYQWGLADNPLFRDNPEKLQRALDEWAHLPPAMQAVRLSGEWYYEFQGEKVYENVDPICVEDFEVPVYWRRARICDPASHKTGAIFCAEDPVDGQWYCIKALELEWKGKLAKTEDIEGEIDKYAPDPDFRYTLSLYDNAEAWFGAHQRGRQGKWRPCIQKKKKLLIMQSRDAMVSGKIKFFRRGAAPLVRQIYSYRRKEDGEVIKKKDHMVDCLQYFCREMPPYQPTKCEVTPDTHEEIHKAHMENLRKKWASNGQTQGTNRMSTAQLRRTAVNSLKRRGRR